MVELIWEGKYDETGRRSAPLRVALPFQTVETVNESAQQRQYAFDLFSAGRDPEWRNRLIWGDKKYVLPSLLPELAGKVNLIYIDPPFATGDDFSFQAEVGDEIFEKEPSLIESKAYRDTWGHGLDGYLEWFYETVTVLHELLAETGSLYVHLDWHVGHYVKTLLDEVFGAQNFHNHITWKRSTPRGNAYRQYPELTDYVFFYTKTDEYLWNNQFVPYRQGYTEKYYSYVDEKTGRLFQPTSILGHMGVNPVYEWRGLKKPWRYPEHRLEELDAAGLLYWPDKGEVPRLKRFLDEQKGVPVQSLWDDIPPVNSQAIEDTGYATQKPEPLLERIVNGSSNENDLVLDCFCGSGTTPAVAEKLGRRWIACDLGRFAIQTARKRLLSIENVRPFVVQNLGQYERQVWQKAEFGEQAEATIRAYRHFILGLYHAEPIDGYLWLHGKKAGRMVHVGTVDAPITPAEVTQIAVEFRKAIGTGKNAPKVAGVDVLGWDFALEVNETTRQIAQTAGLDVRFLKIPREVLEKKAVEQRDIRFFELAALSVDVQQFERSVAITLTDFMVSPTDVPEEVIKAVKHWSEWIDYWAVDFTYWGDTFHNQWQSYRTRKDRSLQLSMTETYDEPGEYTIMVKVIDILGNDTTKAITIEVQ